MIIQYALKFVFNQITWQENVIKRAYYKYMKVENDFKDSFTIKVKRLHDSLFAKIQVFFVSTDNERCGFIINLKDYIDKFEDSKEILLVDEDSVVKPDYYNRKMNLLGSVNMKIYKSNLSENNDDLKAPFDITRRVLEKLFLKKMVDQILQISDLTSMIFEGSPFCKLKAIFGVYIVEYFYKKEIIKSENNISRFDTSQIIDMNKYSEIYMILDKNMCLNIKRLLNFTSASFLDSFMINFTLRNVKRNTVNTTNKIYKSILERVDVREDDIFAVSSGSFESLGFIICEQNGAMIISFRGTLTANDIIHDMDASYSPFMNGYVHTGIFKLANQFYNTEWPRILDFMSNNHIKKIEITGHSLEAAVGIILYLLIQENHSLTFKPLCFHLHQLFQRILQQICFQILL